MRRGPFSKMTSVAFGVIRRVIGIGWIKEAAARYSFYRRISMAPKYNSPLETAGIFELEQKSIEITVT
jgi:hypothetical protein